MIADSLCLIAKACDFAAAAHAPRFVAPVVDDEGNVALEILDAEPAGDHVRVSPDGSAVAVYLPSTSEP